MPPYFIMATVFEPNLFSLARLPSRRHFSSTDMSVCTYVTSRVNSRASAWWFVPTSASRVVRYSALLVAGHSGRSLHTESHSLLCGGGYGGYTLPDSTAPWGPISTTPRGFGRAWATPTKHAQVPISRLEYPSAITLISCRYLRGGYRGANA